MPLAVRYVEPKNVHRKQLPSDVKNELQAVVALSLAGTIRQISSIAAQAESVLGELCDTLADYHRRTEALEKRVKRLRTDVVLASIGVGDDDVDLTMLPLPANHFHSDQRKDQCLLNLHTGPVALLQQYNNAMEKPALHVFTPLWEDGRNALHLYSNPEFFFGHWRNDMEKKVVRKRQSGTLESSCEPPQVLQAMTISHYTKNRISHSATLPSRMRSRKQGKANVKDLFGLTQEPGQRQQRGSEEAIAVTGQEPKDSSSYLSQYSSTTSLMDQESGYGSSGNQENHQRYSTSQSLQSDPRQANGGEKATKFKVLSRNRSSSSVPAESKWRQKTRLPSTSDVQVTCTLPRVHQNEEGAEESKRRATSVTPVPRRKAPPAPNSLTPPSPKSPLDSPLVDRKQSISSITDLVPNGASIFSHAEYECIPIGSKVSPEIRSKEQSIIRGMSLPVTDLDAAFAFLQANPPPITSPKHGHQSKNVPTPPNKNWVVPAHSTSQGADVTPTARNPNNFPEKIAPKRLSHTSPTHVLSRLDSHEETAPASSSTPRRQRLWSRSSSDEDGHKHSAHRLSWHLPENKTNPKIAPKRKDSSESRGRSGSTGHKSKTANQILKQSGVNTVISSQRNKLLVSIRQGLQLKKVQQQKQRFSNQGALPWDVAAILERRQIMESSDNEHEEGAVDDNEWEES